MSPSLDTDVRLRNFRMHGALLTPTVGFLLLASLVAVAFSSQLRYLRERAKSKAIAEKTGHGVSSEDDGEHALLPLVGILSGVFFPFMGPYVGLERQNIASQIATAVADAELDDRGETPVYASSINLFVYIKNSINR